MEVARAARARASRPRVPPPRPPSPRLARPALEVLAQGGIGSGLLRVVAGAGWGKTALLATAARAVGGPVVWCACDRALAGRSLLGRLGRALVPPGLRAPAATGPPARRAEELLEALAALPEPALVVVDAVEELGDGRAARELAELAPRLAGIARLALAARRALPHALGEPHPGAVDLDERDLALSPAEAAELLLVVGLGDAADRAAELCWRHAGWITGILVEARGGDPGRYVAAEVLERLPADLRPVVAELAVLDEIGEDLARAVTGEEDAGALLGRLEDERAVLPSGGGPWRLRPGLRDVALARLRSEGAGLAQTHRRAAAGLRMAGEPEAAARHHLAAGDLRSALEALEPAARRLSGEELSSSAAGWLAAIPPQLWSDASGPVLVEASRLFYGADYRGALATMAAAVERLLREGDHGRAAVVLVRLLRATPLAGGVYRAAIATARDVLPRIDPAVPMLPAARVILGLLLGEVGEHAEAEEELTAAMEGRGGGVPRVAELVALTRAFAIEHPRGAHAAALSAVDAALPVLAVPSRDPLSYYLYGHAFRALMLADLGRHEEALDAADRLADAAAERGLRRVAMPVRDMLRFAPLHGLGRLDELERALARSAADFGRLRGAVRGYRHAVASAQLAAALGDGPAVRRDISAATEALAEHGHGHDAVLALCDLALAARAAGRRDLAARLAARARRQAAAGPWRWAAARAALVAAAVEGATPAGEAALAEALERSADPRLEPLWTGRDRALAAEVLPRAAAAEGQPGATAARLSAALGGVAAPPAPGEAPRRARRATEPARPAVRLRTLGGLQVTVGGRVVPDAAYRRRKARAVLAMLACARAPVHRDALLAAHWPDLEPERGLAALHSTLYALRRALEPAEGPERASSSLVVAQGPAFRLVLGPEDAWDAAEFLAAVREAVAPGGERLGRLLAAQEAYGGPVLPEWAHCDWIEPLRTQVEEAHLRVVEALAEEHSARGEMAAAISRYRLLLAIEPEREGWHRALMRAYAAAGERALAVRQFDTCRRLLRDRLGVEPSAATRELHSAILRHREPEGGQ
jgi:DNA-binding SARP family transcriptional activator